MEGYATIDDQADDGIEVGEDSAGRNTQDFNALTAKPYITSFVLQTIALEPMNFAVDFKT